MGIFFWFHNDFFLWTDYDRKKIMGILRNYDIYYIWEDSGDITGDHPLMLYYIPLMMSIFNHLHSLGTSWEYQLQCMEISKRTGNQQLLDSLKWDDAPMHHQTPTLIFTSNPSGYVWRADLRWDTCQWCTAKKAPGHWCSAPTMSLRSTWRGSSSWMGSTIAAQREGQSAWKIQRQNLDGELNMTWIITWLHDYMTTWLHDNSCFGPHLEEKERTVVCRCDPLTTDGTSKWTACMQAAATEVSCLTNCTHSSASILPCRQPNLCWQAMTFILGSIKNDLKGRRYWYRCYFACG